MTSATKVSRYLYVEVIRDSYKSRYLNTIWMKMGLLWLVQTLFERDIMQPMNLL